MASQMESAVLERTTIEILADGSGKRANLRATGSVVRFDGFLRFTRKAGTTRKTRTPSACLRSMKVPR